LPRCHHEARTGFLGSPSEELRQRALVRAAVVACVEIGLHINHRRMVQDEEDEAHTRRETLELVSVPLDLRRWDAMQSPCIPYIFSAVRTSWMWPSTFTFGKTCVTLPLPSMIYVVLTMPIDFLP